MKSSGSMAEDYPQVKAPKAKLSNFPEKQKQKKLPAVATLIKARFHIEKDGLGGTVKFRWSDRLETEKRVASVTDYLDFLQIIHEADLRKPDWM
jgi:hypothetical protein